MPKPLIVLALLVLPAVAAPLGDDQDAPRQRRRTPITDVYEQCHDAVVNISTTRVIRLRAPGFGSLFDERFQGGPQREQAVRSIGSGVVIHPSGYIVTNAHVVSQATDVRVTFANSRTLPADVVAADPEHDLAVLKVDAPQQLPAARLGRSDDLMIGETVIAIGNPVGLQNTVTAGIVSALDRDLPLSPDVVYHGLIQTDAPINPGNSGGPLLNVNGDLIGINTAIRGDAQSIGFAIPVDRLWELVPAMLDIERSQRVRFGLEVRGPGARVASVRPDSPAARAGLRNDDHVLALNGTPLQDAIDYQVQLLRQKPDSTVTLKVERDKQTLDVKVPLESIPAPDGRQLAETLLGLQLKEIPADIRRRYDLPRYVGLMVEGVSPGGPAEYAGIERGDLILRLYRVSVATLDEVGLALEGTPRGQRVLVEGLRLLTDSPVLWTATLRAGAGR